jgi:hypothetical protein
MTADRRAVHLVDTMVDMMVENSVAYWEYHSVG